jgi:hypothetical protein
MKIGNFYRFAELNVDASRNLSETASIIGEILGIEFTIDSSGKYEEFPAYIAKKDGFTYALLGFPAKEYDLSDDTRNSYDLLVNPVQVSGDSEDLDCSEDIIAQILAANKIRVW